MCKENLFKGMKDNHFVIVKDGLNRGITYWELSLTPISENNKIEYYVVIDCRNNLSGFI